VVTTLLFVHGTGVRGISFAATFQTIKVEAERRRLPVEVKGCFWGESAGAQLTLRGRSVPEYSEAGGLVGPSAADTQNALWSVLYIDPWYELRLLANYTPPDKVILGTLPASAVLRDTVKNFAPNDGLTEWLEREGLRNYFIEARDELVRTQEFQEATATAPSDPILHRQAISRALVARTIVASTEAGNPPVSGLIRDALVTQVGNQLKAFGLGLSDFLLRQIKGFATRYATNRRGQLIDMVTDPGGDILRFLARGDDARAYVKQAVGYSAGRVVLLGHSLGGIMCVDLLARETLPSVVQLVTVGTQAPFLYEIGAMPSLAAGDPLPDHFPPWLNIYDHRDLLSYVGAEVFEQRVTDEKVDNGQPFPESHSAYWTNPKVWDAIERVLP
jgi:hypothetical protein